MVDGQIDAVTIARSPDDRYSVVRLLGRDCSPLVPKLTKSESRGSYGRFLGRFVAHFYYFESDDGAVIDVENFFLSSASQSIFRALFRRPCSIEEGKQ
jgi:hypothetical protein